MAKLGSQNGYTMIELVIVLVIIGIIAGVGVKSLQSANETARIEETKQELNRLACAVAGDPNLVSGGFRSDFGYVGDVGNLPPTLTALTINPGGYATWKGPYLRDKLSVGGSDSEFERDAWGKLYGYSGGVTITASGGPSAITRQIAGSANDLLRNRVAVAITDLDNTPPGPDHRDSVRCLLTYPNASGGLTTLSRTPRSDGYVAFDSIPIGVHTLRVIYLPDNDTLRREVHVNPGQDYYADIQYYKNVWVGGTSSSGCSGSGTLILRPNGSGAVTQLFGSGCGNNWQCVDEASSDGNSSTAGRYANTWAVDYYALENPPASPCTIMAVSVHARARRTQSQGDISLGVYTHGNLYQGSAEEIDDSYHEYHEQWPTNPSTGTIWTWQEVTDLQAGLRLRGQSLIFPALCTQVWVEVAYGP
jgi:general secretion pathway protein G